MYIMYNAAVHVLDCHGHDDFVGVRRFDDAVGGGARALSTAV